MSKEIQKSIQEIFKIQQLLGSGAYGHVWKVTEKQTQKTYALKKVFDAFQNDVDAQRTYRQITILHELDNCCIIKLKGVVRAKNDKDLYIVFQHMETDLHSLVGENILQIPHLLFIIYQIFKGLKYLHSAQLIHRDLKPSNVLINSDCEIKLCDFGLVRSLTYEQDTRLILSQDVATRWYRSPQMLLGSHFYDQATDVWSVGCILAQLLIGEPLLMGGSNIEQLQKILQLTGIPKYQDIEAVKSPVGQSLIQQFKTLKKPFWHYFKGSKYQSQVQLIDLIKRMLQFNPQKRITVDEVLNHELLVQIRSPKQENLCQKVIIPQLDDNVRLKVQQYRNAIYKDIERRYPQYNHKPVQQKEVLRNTRPKSLLNRISSTQSFTRIKATNSLMRPTRSKDKLVNKDLSSQIKNKLNQHQSLHSHTLHTSIFYKLASQTKHNQKAANSMHHPRNIFSQIKIATKQQNKDSTDVSTTMEKSPFRKIKTYTNNEDLWNNLDTIKGLNKQDSLQKQRKQYGGTQISPSKSKKTNCSKPYLFDPASIYNQSPPKGYCFIQKNVYETLKISNHNKITKKTFTRSKRPFLCKESNQNINGFNSTPPNRALITDQQTTQFH